MPDEMKTCARLWLLCGSLLLAAAAVAADGALPPGAVAMVNGQAISRSLLDELARARNVPGTPTERQTRQQLLDDLVNLEIVNQRAQASGVAARPQTRAEVDLAYKTLLGQHLLRRMSDEMQIDEAALQARYRDMPARELIEASHIVVADEATARHVLAALRRGERFEDLARRHSLDAGTRERGGALGSVAADELSSQFVAAARGLKPGQTTSEPVRTEFGWHVIRLASRRTEAQPGYDAVRATLRQQIVAERLQAQLTQWKKAVKLTVWQAP